MAANGVARPGGRLAVATRALASAKFLGRKSVGLRRRDRTGQVVG